MPHKISFIKEIVLTLLEGKTLASDRVWKQRPGPLWQIDKPIIVLSVPQEVPEFFSSYPITVKRVALLSVESIVQSHNYSTYIELMGEQVEKLLYDGKAIEILKDLIPIKTTFKESFEGEVPIGFLNQVFQITYYTEEGKDVGGN